MDINMPVMDGISAAEEIRKMLQNAEIDWKPKIIAVTAFE